jgi:hypothetical protein
LATFYFLLCLAIKKIARTKLESFIILGCLDNHWRLVNELEGIPNQSLINRRLCYVFLTAQDIIFVYNNRTRKYSLANGSLVYNKALRNARNYAYDGEDISHFFIR